MNEPKKINRKGEAGRLALVLCVIALTGILFYLLNLYTPLYGDDYSYAFSFADARPITEPGQIPDSMRAHYYVMNGRIVDHALAQLFLMLGDRAFNGINTVFFLALLFLIYFHGCGSFRDFSLIRFSMIAMLLFLCAPAFGQSFLWITGAANYMYGILIILLVLIPYRVQLRRGSFRRSAAAEILLGILYFPLGVLGGWTNENTAVAMFVIIAGYILCFALKKIRLRVWHITGGVGTVLGAFLMITAPGTAGRLSNAGGSGGLLMWVRRAVMYTFRMFDYFSLIFILFAVLAVLYIYPRRQELRQSFRETAPALLGESAVTLIYFVGFLASVYSMIVSPAFPGRAWSGPLVLALIMTAALSMQVPLPGLRGKTARVAAVTVAAVICLSVYGQALYELRNVDYIARQREAVLMEAAAAGETTAAISPIRGSSGYSCFPPMGDLTASGGWLNSSLAIYYGLDEVTTIP